MSPHVRYGGPSSILTYNSKVVGIAKSIIYCFVRKVNSSYYPTDNAPKDFIYLVKMASWVSTHFKLPWMEHQPLDVIDYFAGAARIAKCATMEGFQARAYDLLYDTPPAGESSHSQMPRRSAFDFCGEAGFWLLNLFFGGKVTFFY